MEKRKVNGGGGGEDLDERSAKRRKGPADTAINPTGETPDGTTKMGLALLETVRKTVDKSGRLISTNFLTLPNKKVLPDYYDVIKMPIALDTIEAKLKRNEFHNLSALESYFKRMILNAKEYNQKGSEIYDDAERLRKALSNFMTRNNPAYKAIPGYQSVPTPLPGDQDAEGEPDDDVKLPAPSKKKSSSRLTKSSEARTQRSSTTPALSDSPRTGFVGLTFQQAQEKIVLDLIKEKELPGDQFSAFEPFIDLPSRKDYPDYYDLIEKPTSLKTLQKSIRGVRGKSAATGISEFKSWAALEDEFSLIWKNAHRYNEDTSEIAGLSRDLKKVFTKALEEAKAVVPEPAGTKIKLRIADPAPKIMLKLGGGSKASPLPIEPAASPALNGQSNGSPAPAANGATRRNPFGGSHSSATPIPSLEQLDRARSVSGSVASPSPSISAPVKNEEVRNSPAVPAAFNGFRGSQGVATPGPSSMQPPSTPGTNLYTQSGFAQSFNHHPQYHPPNPGYDSKWRQPGKDASDAMIVNLSLATHPQLNISRHFRMDVPPSATMAQHSVTINLPASHFYLQIKPELSNSVLQRHHKLFVTKGNDRLHAMPTIPNHPVDQKRPLFETRLAPGVNRIDIELIAALPKGQKSAAGQEAELERITVFANLMR